jgi:hypothetical protein
VSVPSDYADALARVDNAIDVADSLGPFDVVAGGRVAPFKSTRDRIAVGWAQSQSTQNADLAVAAERAMVALASDAEAALLNADGTAKVTSADDAVGVGVATSQGISDTASSFADKFTSAASWITGGIFVALVLVGLAVAYKVKKAP